MAVTPKPASIPAKQIVPRPVQETASLTPSRIQRVLAAYAKRLREPSSSPPAPHAPKEQVIQIPSAPDSSLSQALAAHQVKLSLAISSSFEGSQVLLRGATPGD